jgi:hypothetical protein
MEWAVSNVYKDDYMCEKIILIPKIKTTLTQYIHGRTHTVCLRKPS